LEAKVTQKVIVTPDNDAPEFIPPVEEFHITVGEQVTLDLTSYISDVDNAMTELSLSTDDPDYITPNGLKLLCNYPSTMTDKKKSVDVTVSDGDKTVKGKIKIFITDNHPPVLTNPFPTDIELWGGIAQEKVLDLKNHFMDPDGDDLTFTAAADSEKVIITIRGSEVDMEAMPNMDQMEKIRFRATDVHGAFVEGDMEVRLKDINNYPRVKEIPNLYIRYYDPLNHENYPGYSYDFSYFIYDPDNPRSELSIRAIPFDPKVKSEYIKVDPDNRMKLIFRFPFELADPLKKYPINLGVKDPDPKSEVYRMFNVTILFNDQDDTTSYSVVDSEKYKIKIDIDSENNVDLSSKVNNWNGDVEVVILAHDNQPEQYVYGVFIVHVTPVNDIPTIDPVETIIVQKGVETIENLEKYIDDVDTDLEDLDLESSDPEHVDPSNLYIYINYNKEGTYKVDIKVIDVDGKFANTTVTIKVEAKPTADDVIPAWFYYSLGIGIVIVILIIVFLMVMFTRYKVHEVFLIHQSGILLTHLSREHIPGRDEEILSGMFTAVQEFIKDSFSSSGRTGKPSADDDFVLQEMKIGNNNNILIERGKYAYLAVIFSGRGANKLRMKVRNILNSIETKYELPFKTWVGDMDKIAGVEKLLQPLIPEGGRPVIVSDKQLGRIPAPKPGIGVPRVPEVTPAPKPPTAGVTTITPQPAAAAPAPVKAVTPISPVKPAQPAAAVPAPAKPATATAVAAKPAVATAAPAPKCPQCGAIANKFPDGSMLCPKCGYTGK
jgi:hypothetical protein